MVFFAYCISHFTFSIFLQQKKKKKISWDLNIDMDLKMDWQIFPDTVL